MNPVVSSSRRALVPCALLALMLTAACWKHPLEFTVTFKKARNLAQGHAVLFNGVRIGEVTRVDLDAAGAVEVGVRIEPEHKGRVFRESQFTIDKPGGFTDVSGERALMVTNEGSGGTPITPGDVVRGSESLLAELADKTKAAIAAAASLGTEVASRLGERLKALGDSPAVRQFLENTSARASEAGTAVSEEARNVYRDRRKALIAEAERLRDELKKAADDDQANRFWEDFQTWAKEHLPEEARTGK